MPAIASEAQVLWHGNVIEIGAFVYGVLQRCLVVIICIMRRSADILHSPNKPIDIRVLSVLPSAGRAAMVAERVQGYAVGSAMGEKIATLAEETCHKLK